MGVEENNEDCDFLPLDQPEKFLEAIKYNPIPTFILLDNGEIIYYNKATEKLLGYTCSEIKNLGDLTSNIHPDKDQQKYVYETITRGLPAVENSKTELEVVGKDGTKK
jgi:PAS domain S-box-containing protein